ncbi:MAG: cation transporter [Lachnospiraceae bacterium]|nr:cation transporter [Lachnospiraceae bacterium]
MESNSHRNSVIIKTGVIGIIANVLLASFKAVAGFVTGSIAIILDAVNNLSDALSSVITIIGAWYGGKLPDKEHPLGHGRAEYISASVISLIVLYAGFTSLIESVKKILDPSELNYTKVSLIIIIVAVLVKFILGSYVGRIGKEVNSKALMDSGKDAILDALISVTTLLAAVIYISFQVSTEAYLGGLISIYIIKTGSDMLKETVSDILGKRVDPEISKNIRKSIMSFEDVRGAYDLIMHNYGPNTLLCSVHIEVDESLNANRIDELSRQIASKVYEDYGVIMEAIGIYSVNTTDPEIIAIRRHVMNMIYSHDHILQVHGFRADSQKKTLQVDVIIEFSAPDRIGIYEHLVNDLKETYPDYDVNVTMDIDASD